MRRRQKSQPPVPAPQPERQRLPEFPYKQPPRPPPGRLVHEGLGLRRYHGARSRPPGVRKKNSGQLYSGPRGKEHQARAPSLLHLRVFSVRRGFERGAGGRGQHPEVRHLGLRVGQGRRGDGPGRRPQDPGEDPRARGGGPHDRDGQPGALGGGTQKGREAQVANFAAFTAVRPAGPGTQEVTQDAQGAD